MTTRGTALLRLAATAALAISLSGCISLSKEKPSTLYRFGAQAPATAPPAEAASARVGVYRANGTFQREAAGDRILTVTGDKAAYIARARWVAPAEVLFDEAVLAAFDATPSHVRLVSRGEPAKAEYALRLDMRNFETHYASDGDTPKVLVRVRAVLLRDANHTEVSEKIFEAQVPASENRIGAIVTAYDAAIGQVLKDIVAWVGSGVTG